MNMSQKSPARLRGCVVVATLAAVALHAGRAQEAKPDLAKEEKERKTIYRDPFVLKFPVDAKHYYEERFGKVPYVDKGVVYLFKGDDFGVTLDVVDGVVKDVRYQPDVMLADMTLKLTQEESADGSGMMMLEIRNNTKYTVRAQAQMRVPGSKESAPTNILPVGPGQSNFESWMNPIVTLTLYRFSVEERRGL